MNVYSQIDSAQTFTTGEFRLLLNEIKKDVLYEFADTSNKVLITADSIKINSKSYKFRESIANLKEVGFERNGTFWAGLWQGALVGFALGFLTGGWIDLRQHTSNNYWHVEAAAGFGVLVAVPFSLFGGVFSVLSTHFEYEKLIGNTTGTKRFKLIKAIREGKK